MPAKQSSSTSSSTITTADSIPEKESLESKFKLTESNLKRWLLGPVETGSDLCDPFRHSGEIDAYIALITTHIKISGLDYIQDWIYNRIIFQQQKMIVNQSNNKKY